MNGPNFVTFLSHDKRIFTSPRNWARVPKLPVVWTFSYRCLNYTATPGEPLKWNVELIIFLANLGSYYEIGFVVFALQVGTWRTVNGIILSGTTSIQWQTLNSVSAVKALSLFMPMVNYFDTRQEIKPSGTSVYLSINIAV